MSPRLLLEVLYGYQANIMPHSLVPKVIYSAACNPSSVLLTSSQVDIWSPVGDILALPSQVSVLGIDEADSMNELLFASWKQLNILRNTTERHFVLVFLTSPESYWTPSSILPPGWIHLVPSVSHPTPPARTDSIPSVSYPAPPDSPLAHMDSILSISYLAPPACMDSIPVQLVPSVFHPGPPVILPSFISPAFLDWTLPCSNIKAILQILASLYSFNNMPSPATLNFNWVASCMVFLSAKSILCNTTIKIKQ
ncbi:hypothetical protein EV368DRAFT_89678 [Lentinula lateritia]|nr:hypothetical protein EV368DRAFT_89678 [Lentinula lateritia]